MSETYESGYVSTLSKKLDPAGDKIYVATLPTKTKGRCYMKNGEQKEWVSYSGLGADYLDNVVRQLSTTADPATSQGDGYTWIAGTEIKIVQMHDQAVDKQQTETVSGAYEFTDTVTVSKGVIPTTYATTAARDTALGADGAATEAYTNIYVTATGKHYNYNLGTNQWEEIDTGTSVSNASTTNAGISEESTSAEHKAGTGTGGTGAPLFSSPDVIQASIQAGEATYLGASATGNDSYTVTATPTITALTTGMRVSFLADVANTGACSLTIDATATKSIKTLDGNDPQDGAVRIGINTVVYDGTNFVLQSEDFSNTDRKGTVESATDAETVAGTAGKYPDSGKIKTAYENGINVVTGTRTIGEGTGSESIAHGCPRTPILVLSFYNESTDAVGSGFYADSAQSASRILTAGQARSTSLIIDGGTSGYSATVTGIDSTNLDVTRSGGTDTTTYTLVFLY